MSKLRCPKCGYEWEESNVDLAHFNEAVEKAVKSQAVEIRKNTELLTSEKYQQTINDLSQKIKDLQNQIELDKQKALLTLKDKLHEQEVIKDDQIKHLEKELEVATDYKTRMNVKDLGEDLEQYCENKFNAIRANTYPNAYFAKDSDLKANQEKGDYIFRDYIINGEQKIEYISILFDMKNEDKDAKTKRKNSDYFKKLDSDRNAKHCEYAVLVSMHEQGNELYDQGITDVSYEYPKMFVVRPQHFLTIIALLRNAALSNAKAKQELAVYQQQNIDITNFDKQWGEWKEGFKGNMALSAKHFEKAIAEIEATIKKLEKTKEELEGSVKQLGFANSKVEGLTLKKLTKNSPSLQEKLTKK